MCEREREREEGRVRNTANSELVVITIMTPLPSSKKREEKKKHTCSEGLCPGWRGAGTWGEVQQQGIGSCPSGEREKVQKGEGSEWVSVLKRTRVKRMRGKQIDMETTNNLKRRVHTV